MREKWGRGSVLRYKVYSSSSNDEEGSSSSDDEDSERKRRKRMNFTRKVLPARSNDYHGRKYLQGGEKTSRKEILEEKSGRIDMGNEPEKSQESDEIDKSLRGEQVEKNQAGEEIEKIAVDEVIENNQAGEEIEKIAVDEVIENNQAGEEIEKITADEVIENKQAGEEIKNFSVDEEIKNISGDEEVEKATAGEGIDRKVDSKNKKNPERPDDEENEKNPEFLEREEIEDILVENFIHGDVENESLRPNVDDQFEVLKEEAKDGEIQITGGQGTNRCFEESQEDVFVVAEKRNETREVICAYEANSPLEPTSAEGLEDSAEHEGDTANGGEERTSEIPHTRKRKNVKSSKSGEEEDEWTPSSCKPAKIPRDSIYILRERNKDLCLAEEDVKMRLNPEPTKLPFDLLSLTEAQLQRYIIRERFIKSKTSWRFNISQICDNKVSPMLLTLFKKWGFLVETLEWTSDPTLPSKSQKNLLQSTNRLGTLLSHCCNLKEICLSRLSPVIVKQFLGSLMRNSKQGKLNSLESFKVISMGGDGVLRKSAVKLLVESQVLWRKLELGDFLMEDEGVGVLERLLENSKETLTSLVIHGGFEVSKTKDRILVNIPKMDQLENLSVCLHYADWKAFMMKINKLRSGRNMGILKEKADPFKVVVQFTSELPNLRNLAMDSCVEIEKLPFSIVRKLESLLCGNQWNLSIQFPAEGSRSAKYGASVASLQLPVRLRSPEFVGQVARFFPNLVEIFMELPSMDVLLSFFDHFSSSEVEVLTLRTQFDFETMLESCLFPESCEAVLSEETQKQIGALKEYKWMKDYCSYFNVEFPKEEKGTKSPGGQRLGLGGLKCLKRLHLEHVPRVLSIPKTGEERRWDVRGTRFRNDLFCGFSSEIGGYPLSAKCQEELVKLNLEKVTLKAVRV